MEIIDAIVAINPDAEVSVSDNSINAITWENGTSPISKADIELKLVSLQAEYDSKQYARDRLAEYPPIGDQLDALWKGGDDAAAMKVIVDKVKSDNPKG